MYYMFKTKKCLDKASFIKALADFTGWPVAYTHSERKPGKTPFIEVNRFCEDVTLSRITQLSDKEITKLIEETEKIADNYWPAGQKG